MYVSEIFRSIQGEGIYMGQPTIFIRLAGCNVFCNWCDTKYAQTTEGSKKMTPMEIVKFVDKEFPTCRHICITGGEPLLQRKGLLTLVGKFGHNRVITLETSGVSKMTYDDDIIAYTNLVSVDDKCPSSGVQSDMLTLSDCVTNLFETRVQIKYVIKDIIDFNYAVDRINYIGLRHFKRGRKNFIIFQPCYDENIMAIKDIVELIMEQPELHDLNIRVMPQLHKIIWGDKRGV